MNTSVPTAYFVYSINDYLAAFNFLFRIYFFLNILTKIYCDICT